MPFYRPSAGAPSSSGSGAPSARSVVASFRAHERAFLSARSVDERRALAASLSAEPSSAPEAHALQAALLLRSWPLRPEGSRLPPWRHLPLPGPSRLAWARLAIAVDPACSHELAASEPALWASALDGLDLLDAPDVRAVLETLLVMGNRAAERALQNALPEAVARGLLSAPEALSLLLRRGDAWALSTLARPWACGLPLPLPELRRALRDGRAAAALEAAAARGLWGEIRFLLAARPSAPDDATPVDWALRRAAVEQAGRLGDRETVGELLSFALEAPAELGDEALRALSALHHRGHFVQGEHADAVLALLSAGASLPADDLSGLLFVARRSIIERLPEGPDDALWLALAPLLARWRLAPRPPSGLVERLITLARATRRPALLEATLGLLRGLAIALPDLEPEPLEAVALLRFDDAPPEALLLLEATAGEVARAELRRRLDLERCGAPDETLSPHVERAMLVLWHATPPDERAQLIEALDPTRLPAALVPLLQHALPDRSARAALELRFGAEDPDGALIALSFVATPVDLPTVELALLRSIEKAACAPLEAAGPSVHSQASVAFRAGAEPAPRRGEEAQQLAGQTASALDALEARWRPLYSRPRYLLAPGPRLRAELLLRAVEAAPERAAVLVTLLRSLLGIEHPRLPAVAARLLAHPDDDVAKLAARLLAQGGAAWLSLELTRGAAEDSDRRARACLQALAAAGGPAAESAALGLLGRPTMNLKKTGAEALRKLATPSSAPTLLRWLGQHDDPGLRAALGGALKTALGEGVLSALLAAIGGAHDDEGRQRLLIAELDGQVTPQLARALLRQAPPWSRLFFEALADGTVSLRGASPPDLDAELCALGLCPPQAPLAPRPPAPLDDAVDELSRLGWSASRAEAVLAHWPDRLTPKHVATLRRDLRPWLDAMVEWRNARPALLLDVVLAAGPDETELAWLREAAPRLGALLQALPPRERATLWPALERLARRLDSLDRLDLGESLRSTLGATPGLARSPLGALLCCGLVLRRDDVERALAGVVDVPDPRAVRREILAEAFGVAGPPSVDPSPSDEEALLRERADEAARAPREAWPAALDALEALRPIGVATWSWPAPPASQRRRPPKPRPSASHAARLDGLRVWLTRSKDAPEPSLGHFAEATPDEVLSLVNDAVTAERLAYFLGYRATRSLRRAYRAWLIGQAAYATASALVAALRAALEPPKAQGVWSTSRARARLRNRWHALLTTPPVDLPLSPAEATETDRAALRREALGHSPEAARRALTLLSQAPDAHWQALVIRAAEHPSARVRAHAMRLIRRTLDRQAYFAAARNALLDRDPAVRRSAIRAVGYGGDAEALPQLVSLLLDPVSWVRDEALSALERHGDAGLAAIRHGMARARPDEARRLEQAARRWPAT